MSRRRAGISTGIALTINSTDSVWFILNDQYWADYYAKSKNRENEVLAGGATAEGIVQVSGKQLPLPAGSWIVAADGASDWNDKRYGSFGDIRSLVLARIVDGRVDAVGAAYPVDGGRGRGSRLVGMRLPGHRGHAADSRDLLGRRRRGEEL